MDAISMLHPENRCVRSKMSLFLRLWMARYRYEQLRPFGKSACESLGFHLRQLEDCWRVVLQYQKALGLEVVRFVPQDQFETIYIASGYVERELASPRNTVIDLTELWREYVAHLGSLSHEVNPFDFGEICARCARLIQQINGTLEPEERVIPLHSREEHSSTAYL